uniref:hypothetical protein n=1 Tax=Thaumasiovibrio occultus TaxID=1891184 RepID=UPI000B354D3D|nr:hypothetical protein [Thaumasiovibrio occultus]
MKTQLALSAIALLLVGCQTTTQTTAEQAPTENRVTNAALAPEALAALADRQPLFMERLRQAATAFPPVEFTAHNHQELTMAQARAFEQRMFSKPAEDSPSNLSWMQPANKEEPCLLPMSKSFMAEPNARAFWDGECKEGYAHGLGRDIAISDETHMEEITVHDLSVDQPRLNSFKNFTTGYSEHGVDISDNNGAFYGRSERFGFSDDRMWMYLITGKFDDESLFVEKRPFSSRQYSRVTIDDVVSYSHAQYFDPEHCCNAKTYMYDPTAPDDVFEQGLMRFFMRNGNVQNELMTEDGNRYIVEVPEGYWDLIDEAFAQAVIEAEQARVYEQAAIELEQAYLKNVCRVGVEPPTGLDIETYQKACVWPLNHADEYLNAIAHAEQFDPAYTTVPQFDNNFSVMLDNPNEISQSLVTDIKQRMQSLTE